MGPLLVILVVGAVIAAIAFQIGGSSNTLQQWAAENGYTLLETERRMVRRGPYFFTTAKGQEVFFVRLRDREGQDRTAYVRVGGFLLGPFSDKVHVSWQS